jgi:hypothetical protein
VVPLGPDLPPPILGPPAGRSGTLGTTASCAQYNRPFAGSKPERETEKITEDTESTEGTRKNRQDAKDAKDEGNATEKRQDA